MFILLPILAVALLFTLVFAAGFRRQRNKTLLMMYFIALFFATWAGTAWINPASFPEWGSFWLPLAATGFIFALLLAAFIPPAVPPLTSQDSRQRPETGRLGFDVLVLILLTILIFAIAASYL